MAEVTNELIYEVLKAIQPEVANMRAEMNSTNVRLGSLTDQVRGVALEINAAHTDIANIYNRLDRVDGRLGRIERRLDIVEQPVS